MKHIFTWQTAASMSFAECQTYTCMVMIAHNREGKRKKKREKQYDRKGSYRMCNRQKALKNEVYTKELSNKIHTCQNRNERARQTKVNNKE